MSENLSRAVAADIGEVAFPAVITAECLRTHARPIEVTDGPIDAHIVRECAVGDRHFLA